MNFGSTAKHNNACYCQITRDIITSDLPRRSFSPLRGRDLFPLGFRPPSPKLTIDSESMLWYAFSTMMKEHKTSIQAIPGTCPNCGPVLVTVLVEYVELTCDGDAGFDYWEIRCPICMAPTKQKVPVFNDSVGLMSTVGASNLAGNRELSVSETGKAGGGVTAALVSSPSPHVDLPHKSGVGSLQAFYFPEISRRGPACNHDWEYEYDLDGVATGWEICRHCGARRPI